MKDLIMSRLLGTLKSRFKINRLMVDASALTDDRTLIMPDRDVDLGALVQPDYLLSETGELIIATDGELLRF